MPPSHLPARGGVAAALLAAATLALPAIADAAPAPDASAVLDAVAGRPVAAASRPLHGRATVRVPLRASWRVRTRAALVLADGAMTCRVAALVARAGAPASAALVACVGPAGSPGLAYPLRVTVRGAAGARATVRVRFPVPRFATVSALAAAAPPPTIPGTPRLLNGVRFLVPAGWSFADGAAWSRIATGSGPTLCEVFVFHPVVPDLSSGGTSLLAQLQGQIDALFQGTGLAIAGPNGVPDRGYQVRAGTTGFGFPWVGATLDAGGNPVEASLIAFASNAAVDIVKVGQSCMDGFPSAPQAMGIELTASMPAASPPDIGAYRATIRGGWSFAGSTVGALYVFAGNGHYVDAFSTAWTGSLGGSVLDLYLNFAGDGNYAVAGPLVGRFPTRPGHPPRSELTTIFDERLGGADRTRICSVAVISTLTEGCETRDPAIT